MSCNESQRTCPDCCFRGKDYEDMMTVMNFASQWAQEHPEKAGFLKPPKGFHKH